MQIKIYVTFLINLFICTSVFALNSKEKGLLWGSIYGDAFGGPYEFKAPILHPYFKKNKRLSFYEWRNLADSVRLVNYRMKKSAYGIWQDNAPAGTITDDSRHKILFALAYNKKDKVTAKSLANIYAKYSKRTDGMYRQWLGEYSKSAWYIIDPKSPNAMPLERLWGGIPTQAGQMIFPLNALIHPKDARKAYLNTYAINFFDVGVAKDFTSALVGGLSDNLNPGSSWTSFKKVLKANDPYKYAQIPYVKRDVNMCLDKAIKLVDEAKNVPIRLFKLLEEKLNAKTWWEAQTSFIVSMAFLELAYRERNPMAAFALVQGFGHDTDSYAQVIGAVIGSIEGENIFNSKELNLIQNKVRSEFGPILDI